LTFTTGEETTSDLLLGCDGIHSAARTLLVEPDRRPTYTGIAVVMATATIPAGTKLKWETTGLTSSRRGSFMASYFESTRKEQYVAVVMEIAEVADREGWKIRGSDQEAIKADILERFRNESMPELADLTEAVGEWSLYPVFKLPPRGQWTSPDGRCILLGDAAHAVSLQPSI
jgi:2-polyprenyl-6-methoxyphenol hydroxylase-like FAD-dependent oxidoreductase